MSFIAGLMCGAIRAGPGGRVDKIVTAGGSGLDIVEVYDITTNTWETGRCLLGEGRWVNIPNYDRRQS